MSFLLSLLASAAPAATTVPPPPDPVTLVDRAAARRGDRSHVLVLGTAHLSTLPKDMDFTRFAPLLDRLAAWKPRQIAVESLSGAQCDYLRAYAFAYPETAEDYCFDPAPARTALAIDGADAERTVLEMLAQPSHSAADRRRMAGLFLAMGEADSALLQWERLPEADHHASAELPQPLVDILTKRAESRNENVVIAVALAKRLGLERIYPVDDHTGDRAARVEDGNTYGQQIQAIWDSPALTAASKIRDVERSQMLAGGAVVNWYRFLNSPASAKMAIETDFAAAAGSTKYPETGRNYLAYWETRNLRMVANIREVVGPDGRVLAVVGASHKPFYERYLSMTSDIVIDDIEQVLAD
ncbi:hypothetical protein IDJ81_08860 [Tsuneonella flava]|uniref:TraB family protein n=1 Tax=Tsuneonella flava TaxID=2055955 RepID=A0ABX7K8V6_9SPHN|nr:DUF5694 domain-containing protein [Tsuneonella flava]QSB43501.1 hypothetical protein IDJ81_08860 [Tsuneonella flava]